MSDINRISVYIHPGVFRSSFIHVIVNDDDAFKIKLGPSRDPSVQYIDLSVNPLLRNYIEKQGRKIYYAWHY
jgi:hypothetical protein